MPWEEMVAELHGLAGGIVNDFSDARLRDTEELAIEVVAVDLIAILLSIIASGYPSSARH